MAEYLRKRKVVHISWCHLCNVAGEYVDHILLHCSLALRLWWDIFSWFGIFWVMPRFVKYLLFSWIAGRRKSRA